MKTLIEVLRDYSPEAVYRSSGTKIVPDSFTAFYNELLNRKISTEETDRILIVSQGYMLDEDQIVEGDLIPSVFDPYSGETFSPVFMTWEQVLSCPVCEISLEMHGVEQSLFAILGDLTFWGTEEKKSAKIKDAVAAQEPYVGYNEASLYAMGTCAMY